MNASSPTAPLSKCAMMSARPAIAASGKPPPIALPRVHLSGVMTTVECRHLVALLEGAREPHGIEVGLRAGADAPHLLRTRHRVDHLGGEADAVLLAGQERRALGCDLLHDLHDLCMRMGDDYR